ncbi:MAG: hypothetical protein ACE5JA_01370 [bacterium]
MSSGKISDVLGAAMRIVFSVVLALVMVPAVLCQESGEEAPPEEAVPETTSTEILIESIEAEVELPFERELFNYVKEGRRDPFVALVPKEEGSDPNVNNLTLRGIIWGFAGDMAVVKEKGGRGHVLREGSRVSGGEVEDITHDSITFRLSEFGVVTRYTLTLKGEGRK